MSGNPFDDQDGQFFALVNDKGEYSLWPAFAAVPDGWSVALGGEKGVNRDKALRFIEENWTDLSPGSGVVSR